ncbi:MAG: MMPL family transporter [Acidimicrobiales bacterium]|nr:MMPL family transporter [Acidimicrobiales bacterium]
MATLLYRLGHFSVRNRKKVLGAWLIGLLLLGVIAQAAGGETSTEFSIPGTESQEAIDLLQERFPTQSGDNARVVIASDDGSPLDLAQLTSISDELSELPEVLGASDPATIGSISPDGSIAFSTVQYEVDAISVEESSFEALVAAAESIEADGLQVELGGGVVTAHSQAEPESSELIGLAVAVVVLLFAFGSVIAMGLPLITALIGLGIGLMGITLMSAFVDLSETAPILATMIGLAVGIDYALFIVTRHRQNLADGLDVEEAAARANATAGGAVVFAGMTVVIAIGGLAVVGIPFLTVMGLAAAATVFVAVLVAISLLPAMLGFAGHNIDKFTLPGMKAKTSSAGEVTLGTKWAATVTRHPVIALAGGLLVMLLLAIPTLSLRLGSPDAGTQPEGNTQREAYDLLAEGFGPGFNGPLTVVVDLTSASDRAGAVAAVTDAIESDAGIAGVGPANLNEAGDTAVISATPTTGPADQTTEDTVNRLRGDGLRDVEADTGAAVSLTGSTASNIDISKKMLDAIPVFMILVIGLTLLLLMGVFRSIVVPIKAAIAILLSIASSFGVLVAVFQWGWLKDVIGLETTVPIISFLPLLMFAILFGLSMDYEVFIMTRIREEYTKSREATESVLTGLGASARVISAAAIIMVSVFGSFVLGDDPTIKMFGIGLSAAVLLDATVVRMVIVPAVMTLFGDRAWWYPAWMSRITPNFDVEGEQLMHDLEARDAGGPETLDDDHELVGV